MNVVLLPVLDEGAPARAVYAATVRGRTPTPATGAFRTARRAAAAKVPGIEGTMA
ncbi:hypothetical protein [Streptomyces herbicida]|uniref:hypothetical protein n=1 Tax=Streptomyces herbicida TaxID=3065675 RepID=UPI00292FA3F5|nr:hypothetical protein [Streptomyces sp. NEAU-HV9]